MSAQRKEPQQAKAARPAGHADPRHADNSVGRALRALYESAVEEDIPPDMLDLLGKLK
ncbi:NepR family anti-sigma factor [Sphingomonas changnyeongensis]|uniref:NepR family anti-sigma factor n=1 Tax=Sphingomonas changnyeongensis TaxID=2698679 RepID=UPI001E33C8A0|nr:NepR family anti-sigma factor [Sphingomonas changnyeongensis]